MRNSIAAGRRLAVRVLVAQAGVTVLLALAFTLQGKDSGLAALLAGALVVLGNALLALRFFSATHAGAGFALARLVAGTLLKWLLVIGGLLLLIGQFRLPPLPVVCGLGAALLAGLAGFLGEHDETNG